MVCTPASSGQCRTRNQQNDYMQPIPDCDAILLVMLAVNTANDTGWQNMRVREVITHRLGLAETGHFCLSLRAKRGNLLFPHRDCFVPIASGLAKT